MKASSILVMALCIFVSMCGLAVSANPPALYFSDITSGPATGLGDGLGSGTIVTIWGVNLGSNQGTSTISACGASPAHVYHWGNATAQAGHPSDLYTYHKMQFVQFSLASSATGNPGAISVTVGGVTSNALPFTLRSGNIRFVCPSGGCGSGSSTGNDQNSGTWAFPWATPKPAVSVMSPGDITYVGAINMANTEVSINGKVGTAANPFSLLAYPGATPTISYSPTDSRPPFWNFSYSSSFWNFSRFSLKSDMPCLDPFDGGRTIANECTDYCCAVNGQAGIYGAYGNPTGLTILGNFIHDYGSATVKNGCGPSTNQTHTTYFSNRHLGDMGVNGCDSGGWSTGLINGPIELGWNNLHNNGARQGIHFYDENCPAGWGSNVHKVHDNVIVNQVGPALDITVSGKTGWHTDLNVNFYNNLMVNCGLLDSQSVLYPVVTLEGSYLDTSLAGPNGTINYFDNTIYSGSDNVNTGSNVWGVIEVWHLNQGGTTCKWYWRNNIVNPTTNVPYWFANTYSNNPTGASNNLWYYSGGGTTVPSWDSSPVTASPNFTNASGGDFSLQAGSPALAAGYNTTGSVARDILGDLRPNPPAIGAFDAPTQNNFAGPYPPTGLRLLQ